MCAPVAISSSWFPSYMRLRCEVSNDPASATVSMRPNFGATFRSSSVPWQWPRNSSQWYWRKTARGHVHVWYAPGYRNRFLWEYALEFGYPLIREWETQAAFIAAAQFDNSLHDQEPRLPTCWKAILCRHAAAPPIIPPSSILC